ncbi:ATP-dependent helicase [Microbacterium sp. C5A9]|uniref:UvrD-helicase domain-containing protein n=1 Tax=Microbacterium sp. C5A9 TaxID=2736663 RepID=UPI001F52A4D8|nr:ATP-dependent helicase [Microbacterium sp. C5A9]MCI1017353.1 ATP-dependent helicase [Microbacterium sp. C5A9]
MSTPEADWRPHGIDDLEEAAWEALKSETASVAAGPGAGKSEFLAQRASYLLETGLCAHPQQILAISFKRSAATNLRDRVRERLPDHASRFVSMTFDAFTKMIVDRFSNVLPVEWAFANYRIEFASNRDIKDFLTDVAASAPAAFRSGVYAIKADDFLAKHVGSAPLNDDLLTPTTAEAFAVKEWWSYRYLDRKLPTVDFVMLNRLADLIIRTSPHLRRALAVTYPYVFVDEFQDTTFAQYSFLREVFAGTDAQVTAVGDRNQRIMGWAGALSDAFKEFENDFRAETFALTSNYRSSPALVDLQHRFAKLLSPDAAKQASKVISKTGDSAAQVWSFPDPDTEAAKIADWVRDDIDESGRLASDYAILARQQVADIEPRIREAFTKRDLRVRNDDTDINKIRLQDLLGDDLTRLFIDTLRLAASRGGEPDAWLRTASTLRALLPAASLGETWEDQLSDYLTDLRGWFSETKTALPASTAATEIAAGTLDRFTSFLSLELLGNGRKLAENVDEAKTKLTAVGLRLEWALKTTANWADVADTFMDDGAIPLMTIHRSKGLEYHTVFIVGLDDEQWWAYTKDSIEATMTFFVGVSRAAERVIFTRSDDGATPWKIRALYDELEAAGVPFFEMD